MYYTAIARQDAAEAAALLAMIEEGPITWADLALNGEGDQKERIEKLAAQVAKVS